MKLNQRKKQKRSTTRAKSTISEIVWFSLNVIHLEYKNSIGYSVEAAIQTLYDEVCLDKYDRKDEALEGYLIFSNRRRGEVGE